MNNTRRNAIRKIAEQLETLRNEIEDIKSEENDAYENMPESLQYSERGEAAQAAIDALDNAYNSVDEAISSLSEATGD